MAKRLDETELPEPLQHLRIMDLRFGLIEHLLQCMPDELADANDANKDIIQTLTRFSSSAAHTYDSQSEETSNDDRLCAAAMMVGIAMLLRDYLVAPCHHGIEHRVRCHLCMAVFPEVHEIEVGCDPNDY